MTLAAKGLKHSFGSVKALLDVTFSAARGSVCVLIGPNAAGKSTLLRCLCGAMKADEGAVTLDGKPLSELTRARRAASLAYVPQRPVVAAAFSVREIVELGRFALPPNRRRVDGALHRMELGELADRPFAHLSAGQQQRVIIARSLAQLDPDGFLILDEPTAAMDIRHVLETVRLVRELAIQGAGIVLSIHDLTLAAACGDSICLLDHGRVVEAGTSQDVLRPDLLERVFQAPFSWHKCDGDDPILMPSAPKRISTGHIH
jgi:iron complex transport system ATP-binding protein